MSLFFFLSSIISGKKEAFKSKSQSEGERSYEIISRMNSSVVLIELEKKRIQKEELDGEKGVGI
jgi:hypothetical protein